MLLHFTFIEDSENVSLMTNARLFDSPVCSRLDNDVPSHSPTHIQLPVDDARSLASSPVKGFYHR